MVDAMSRFDERDDNNDDDGVVCDRCLMVQQ